MDVAIKKVRNGIDRIFDKTLQDLVRGVRNNKGREKEDWNFILVRAPVFAIKTCTVGTAFKKLFWNCVKETVFWADQIFQMSIYLRNAER